MLYLFTLVIVTSMCTYMCTKCVHTSTHRYCVYHTIVWYLLSNPHKVLVTICIKPWIVQYEIRVSLQDSLLRWCFIHLQSVYSMYNFGQVCTHVNTYVSMHIYMHSHIWLTMLITIYQKLYSHIIKRYSCVRNDCARMLRHPSK